MFGSTFKCNGILWGFFQDLYEILQGHARIIMGSKCNYNGILKAGHQDPEGIMAG